MGVFRNASSGALRRRNIKNKLRVMAGEMRRSARATALPDYMKLFEHAAEELDKKATELDAKEKCGPIYHVRHC
jgi:hypothetical protein